jgi:hypothetical protein
VSVSKKDNEAWGLIIARESGTGGKHLPNGEIAHMTGTHPIKIAQMAFRFRAMRKIGAEISGDWWTDRVLTSIPGHPRAGGASAIATDTSNAA